MHKKLLVGFLAILMALAALLGLAACGSGGTDGEGGGNTHVHKMVHHEATATCTSAGTIEYWYCSGCKKNFSDEAGTHEVKELYVSALSHKYNANNQCSACGTLWVYTSGLVYILNDDGESYSVGENKEAVGDIVLPYYYEGKPVTSIGASAFSGCSGLTSIVIPDSVTSIGYWAFEYCRGLTSVTIGNSVTKIGLGAFRECAVKSIVIPGSVTSIGSYAFEDCHGLTSVTIGNSVTSIGSYAFYNCSGLTSIVIPDSVTSIGDYAFENCSGLTSIVIPDSVTSIGRSAFYNTAYYNTENNWENKVLYIGKHLIEAKNDVSNEYRIKKDTRTIADYAFASCSGLTNYVISDSVTSIGAYAFGWCDGLTSIVIPDSVISIGNRAFYKCGNLTTVNWNATNCTTAGKVSYPNYQTVFEDCYKFTTLKFSSNVKNIPDYAFYKCSNLTSITIPDNVTSIGDYAFEYCSGLISVTIGNGVTSIGCSAFLECSGMTSVTIGSGVTSIGSNAFYWCSKLTRIYYAGDIAKWCGISGLDNLMGSSPTIYIDGKELAGELVIPDSVTSIGDWAFYNCSLTSIVIPDSVTSIGDYAFYGCSGLASIVIPGSVTSIGECAFRGCIGLTIYCEAESKPSGWEDNWKPSNYPVVWGYKGEE